MELVRAEPEPLGGAGAQRLDEDVGAVDEPQQHLLAALVLDIQCERALRRVRSEEHHAAALPEARPPGTSLVAALRMLDLDDVRAERAENLRRGRPGERRGEIDDADPRERPEAHPGDPSDTSRAVAKRDLTRDLPRSRSRDVAEWSSAALRCSSCDCEPGTDLGRRTRTIGPCPGTCPGPGHGPGTCPGPRPGT